MWVFQGTCRHCALKCCWNLWGKWVLGFLYPPCILPACMIRVTICDIPGSGGFFWCGYTTVLCYLASESWGVRQVCINSLALCVLLFLGGGVLMKASFILSIRWFANAAMKVSIFFSFHSSISWILIFGAYSLILLEFCPLSLQLPTSSSLQYFFFLNSPTDFTSVNFH